MKNLLHFNGIIPQTINFNGAPVSSVYFNNNWVWGAMDEPWVPGEDASFLVFASSEAFTIEFINETWDGVLEYSLTGNSDWNVISVGQTIEPQLSNYQYVLYIRGKSNTHLCTNYKKCWTISGTDIKCIGNIETLLDCEEVASGKHPTMADYCFSKLFENCGLIKAPELPAKILVESCYEDMFSGCKSLVEAPELPATTLASYCYSGMFRDCYSLTKTPHLPANTLAKYCYASMFSGCTSLIETPSLLHAEKALWGCYSCMFEGCTSLTKAPSIWASSMDSYGCYYMFKNCTSLIEPPEVLRTIRNIGLSAYESMFENCVSLITPPVLKASIMDKECCKAMFKNCKSLIKAPALTNFWDLKAYCCYEMFYGCESLTEAPAEFSAWCRGESCCESMFEGCTSLTKASSIYFVIIDNYYCCRRMFKDCTSLISAPTFCSSSDSDDFRTAGIYSCAYMFENCTSLTKAPELLYKYNRAGCFYYMFKNCTSLIEPPSEFPNRELDGAHCYAGMFYNCTSLIRTPKLRGIILTLGCYKSMFENCTSLVEITKLPASSLPDDCYYAMFRGTGISLSETKSKSDGYIYEFRIPYQGSSTSGGWYDDSCLAHMFDYSYNEPQPIYQERTYYIKQRVI